MTITQTVEIPADRHITLEIPSEIPTGQALVELNVIPFAEKDKKKSTDKSSKLRLSKNELDKILRNAQTPISNSLTGILSHLGDITIEQIREERLAKYSR